MSTETVNPTGKSATTASAEVAGDPSKAGATPAKGKDGGDGEVTSMTGVRNMEDLKKKAPEVYNMMMQGIASHIVNEMRKAQERLKKMNREARYRG